MKIFKLPSHKSKAQAIVEFAVVLPILLFVVYGLIEAGRLIFTIAFVNNASRQAVRYGSTSGVGPNGVPRYQDCDGIREAAESTDFLNAFDAYNPTEFMITYDNPDGTISFDGVCDGSTDTNVSAVTGDRVNVSINYNFSAIFPNFLPFLSRTVAGGNPIETTSSRTLLLTLNIEPPKEETTTIIDSTTPFPSKINEQVLVTVTVSATTTPTGDVYITGADTNCTITLSGGTGSCYVTFATAGVKSLTASYAGDADHDSSSGSASHQVERALPVVTITSDTPDPSLVTDTVTVTVSVTGTFGMPTGTVTIQGCAAPIDLVNGTGSCTVNFTSTGKKTLTATYSGDSQYLDTVDTERHDVILPTETVTIIETHNPDPSEIGQSITVKVTVGGITPPAGTVAITGADTNCSFGLPTTSCLVTFTSIGDKTITATFTSSNPAQTGSSDSVIHAVQLPATTTTITAHTPAPSAIGETVNVTVTVTGGSTTPTGTVTITGADAPCAITLAGGTGNCNVVFSTSGSKTLTAAYSGDSLHAASNDTETHVVSQPPVTGCNTVTYSLLKQTNGALTMDINNPLLVPLEIGEVTLTWNHDKGHQTGDDKTLKLQFANINGAVFWSGDEIGPTKTITPNPGLFIQPGSSTITFTFHQVFDRWDNTEQLLIHFSTPGCENADIIQTQH